LRGADASFDENEKGSIQQGKLADLRLAFLVSEEAAVRRKSEVRIRKEERRGVISLLRAQGKRCETKK